MLFKKSLSEKKKIFIKGILMGIADLIPAISGSSVALILGIYEKFLISFKNIKIKKLLILDIKGFYKSVDFAFLIPLFLGIFLSFICFSKILAYILAHTLLKMILMSLFLGMIICSIFYLIKEIKLEVKNVIFLVLGTILSFSISVFNELSFDLAIYVHLKLVLSGLIASFAMLLPGISGSFVLLVLGVYPIAIDALADVFKFYNLKVLFFLALGVFIGFVLFPKIILYFLKKYYFLVLSFLIGLMTGSLYSLLPMQRYSKIVFHGFSFERIKSTKLIDFFSMEFLLSFSFVLFGFFIIFTIKEYFVKKNIKI
jgi:putative membrane protein